MSVPWISSGPFLFDAKAIGQAPEAEGVYAIVSINDRLYIGKGKIKEQLISHWNKQNPPDRCIWSKFPVRCFWEVCRDPGARMEEILGDYPTLCNQSP